MFVFFNFESIILQAGALIAVYLAKRGFKVDVFEARKGDFQVSFDSVGSVLEGRGGGGQKCAKCVTLFQTLSTPRSH